MSGNVWEWTLSPYQPDDGRNAIDVSEPRVVRGGSFISDAKDVRCAMRYSDKLGFFGRNRGFRVVASPLSIGRPNYLPDVWPAGQVI